MGKGGGGEKISKLAIALECQRIFSLGAVQRHGRHTVSQRQQKMLGRILHQWQRDRISRCAHGTSLIYRCHFEARSKKQSNTVFSEAWISSLRSQLRFQKLRCTYALDLSACNRDGLPCDRAGTFAAQPKNGIGDFRRGYEARLRNMPG